VLRRWRELSVTLGSRVRVELPGRTLEGIAEDIDASGALIVNGEHVSAGDVIHVRN
jgi:BirA family biotin operon repressor/biotin-[acetyl-CoA-carboxylase] ligase